MDFNYFIEKLSININEEIKEVSQKTSGGFAQSFDHYKYLVGYTDGLKRAANHLQELKHKLMYEDSSKNSMEAI